MTMFLTPPAHETITKVIVKRRCMWHLSQMHVETINEAWPGKGGAKVPETVIDVNCNDNRMMNNGNDKENNDGNDYMPRSMQRRLRKRATV